MSFDDANVRLVQAIHSPYTCILLSQIFQEEEDFSEVMNDPAFLQSVLEGLPGVDTQSEAIKNAVGALTNKQDSDKKEDKKKDEKK